MPVAIGHPEWLHDLYFPPEEYALRLARARLLMDEYGFDGLMTTDDRTNFYYTGYGDLAAGGARARPRFVFLPRNGEPIQLIHRSWLGAVKDMSWAEVRDYSRLGCPIDDVTPVLRELGLERGRIGAEVGTEQRLGISFNDFLAICDALPEARFDDAGELLWRQRNVKTAREIAKIRRAMELTNAAFRTIWPKVRAGMTEYQVRGLFLAELTAADARTGWAMVHTGTGQFDRIAGISRDRAIEPHDMVWIDAGANVGGYWADFSRAGVLGGPNAEQRDYQERIRSVTVKGMEACRPGVTCSDVNRLCEEAMAKEGLTFNTFSDRYGHGVGLAVTEMPHISADDDTPIEPGMVLAMEPGFYTDTGLYHIEQNLLVTEYGYENLSTVEWQLATIDG